MEHDGRKDTETNHNSANYRKSRWGGRLSLRRRLTARLVILSRANAVDGTVIAAIVTTDDVTTTIITTII